MASAFLAGFGQEFGSLGIQLLGGPEPSTETARLAQALKSPASAAVLGVVLLALGVGAGWLGYRKSQDTITYEPVDLSAGQTPFSNHAVLTGIAHTKYLVQLESKRRGSTTIDNYFPLASSAWRRGEPLVYFVKTNATAYLPQGGGQTVMLSGRTPPFQMTTEKALLVRNGLPGPVGEAFRKTITVHVQRQALFNDKPCPRSARTVDGTRVKG